MRKISKFNFFNVSFLEPHVFAFLFLILCGFRLFSFQYLFADGSYQLLYIIVNEHFYLDPGREFMQVIAQAPSVLAVKLFPNVSGSLIAFLLTFGYLCLPFLFLYLTLVLVSRASVYENVLIKFGVIVLVLTSSATMSESFFASSLFLLILTSLLFLNVSKRNTILIFLMLTISLRCYDSYSLYSTLILISLLTKKNYLRRSKNSLLFLAFVLFNLLSLYMSFKFVIERSSNFSYISPSNYMNMFNLTAILGAALCSFAVHRKTLTYVVLSGLCSLTYAYFAWHAGLAQHFLNRIPVSLLLVLIGLAVLGSTYLKAPKTLTPIKPIQSFPLLILGISLVLNSLAWNDFRNSVQLAVLDSKNQFIAFESLNINKAEFDRYGWAWTFPSLSAVLGTRGDSPIVLNPSDYTGWQPWEPKNGTNLPKNYSW